MYDRILVPLDGSPFAEQVLPLAATIARQTGMMLELVKVRRRYHVGYGSESLLGALDLDARDRELSARYLNVVAERLSRGAGLAPHTALLEGGSTADEICGAAAREHATLIAMTTHGRTGLLRTVRGSVADGVLRQTTVPVLLWRTSDPPAPAPATIEHILVALDGSTWAETVVPVAAMMAHVLGARISLVRVVASVAMAMPAAVPAPMPDRADAAMGDVEDAPPVRDEAATARAVDRARDYVEHVARRIRADHPELVIGLHAMADDDAARAILRTATELHADVLAMATHGRGASRLVVGSTVDRVVHARAGAMLLVRPDLPDASRHGSVAPVPRRRSP